MNIITDSATKCGVHTMMTHPVWIIIENNQISIADIEAAEMIARIFRIKDIFINNIRSPFGFCCCSTEIKMSKGTSYRYTVISIDLTYYGQFRNNRTYTLICLMAPYFPKMSYISSAVILYGRFLTYNILFTSGGNLT